MNYAIAQGPVPSRPGLEREEPELVEEYDIPTTDGPAPEEVIDAEPGREPTPK